MSPGDDERLRKLERDMATVFEKVLGLSRTIEQHHDEDAKLHDAQAVKNDEFSKSIALLVKDGAVNAVRVAVIGGALTVAAQFALSLWKR